MHRSAILLFVLTFTSMAFPYELVGTVVGITDGDTLKLLVDNQQYKIRLSEIDTPEKDQPWGKNATKALSEKVFREEVRIDVIDTDRYGRLIAFQLGLESDAFCCMSKALLRNAACETRYP